MVNRMHIDRRHRAAHGLSLVELLMALAISAMLLTATMAALDASFKAYANAAEQASSQTATRMVTHRLLTLIRTSTAHGPLEPDDANGVTLSGSTISSPYIELIDQNGTLLRVEYKAAEQKLVMIMTPPSGIAVEQPIMTGITHCSFQLVRRENDDGLLVLERGTITMTVQPGEDATLAIENGAATPIQVVASTMPRRLEE